MARATTSRRRCFWVALAVALVLAVLAALGWFAAVKLADRADSSTPPPSGEEWIYDTFVLSPPEHWERNTEVDGWTDQTNCAETSPDCPKVYIDDLKACETEPPDPLADPYAGTCSMDGPPIELEASRLCGWEGPVETEEANIGGETAEFFTLNDCPGGSRYWWHVKDMLFSAEDPAGLIKLDEVTPVLEEDVVWTS